MTLLKDAKPYPVRFETDTTALLLIDMQRDFLEPGGFGEMLGNDVSLLRGTIEPCRALLLAARATNMSGPPSTLWIQNPTCSPVDRAAPEYKRIERVAGTFLFVSACSSQGLTGLITHAFPKRCPLRDKASLARKRSPLAE